jgi:L,D-transpeptidase catalytic domain
MTKLLEFRVRTHGQDHPDGSALNQLCGDGSTPTGRMSFDLNSPESNPKLFGPFPINRAIIGKQGNAAIRRGNATFISDFRDGILLHTGEWAGWKPPMPMPNSHGCIHSWPQMIERVWKLLVGLGVEVRPNTNGKLPYPYKPQGELSVECLDCHH